MAGDGVNIDTTLIGTGFVNLTATSSCDYICFYSDFNYVCKYYELILRAYHNILAQIWLN
jgi:hypothetical protein